MKFRILINTVLLTFVAAYPAAGTAPPMPPDTNGGSPANDGMKHINISLTGSVVGVTASDPPASPVTMLSGFGDEYTPSKFDVLEDVYFNAQHGWLSPGGFLVDLPPGASIWMKRTGATQPAGSTFKVYEGGNAAEGMASWSMNEIYAANGDVWQWDGAMQHDYFTADMLGDYSMSFEVYVGDAVGDQVAGTTSATTTFQFQVVPEPTACVMALLGSLGLLFRRR